MGAVGNSLGAMFQHNVKRERRFHVPKQMRQTKHYCQLTSEIRATRCFIDVLSLRVMKWMSSKQEEQQE